MDRWNEWVETHVSPTPLTAHGAWGRLLESEGVLTDYFFVRDQHGTIVAGCPLQILKTSRITYGYSARGPLFIPGVDVVTVMTMFVEAVRSYRLAFWRIEPTSLPEPLPSKYIKTNDVQPATTLLLDLNITPEKLLENMHQKTRYNIRLAQKKGLTIRWEKNSELFWKLSLETSKRDGFRLHARAHYENVLASGISEQVTVYQGETALASAVTTRVGDTYSYLYGASSSEARSLMAPYLIQWSAIVRAQEYGAHWYDFYGLAPLKLSSTTTRFLTREEHTYDSHAKEAGYTRFKLGFGGQILTSPGTWDVVFSLGTYGLYRGVRALRKFFV